MFLEFSSDGLLDFTHTLATTIVMCNRIERRYRLKLQQILYLSVTHPGDTTKRLHHKKCYRKVVEKIEADQRMESIKKAFELSDDRVRNLWVNLSHKASMFSKFSAASYDSDLEDADEAMINVSFSIIFIQINTVCCVELLQTCVLCIHDFAHADILSEDHKVVTVI